MASNLTALPWVSGLAILGCIGIYVGLAAQEDLQSWETLARFGYLTPDVIWDGGYWALVTCVFVHFELWHLAFNLYWLWVLGSHLEREIGSLPFLAFFVVSAFVSSSFQLAVSDETGIGASGVVFAVFGLMWVARQRYPSFGRVLTTQTIQLFLIWLVGCVVVTYLGIWRVGNTAHIVGLLFGGTVGCAFFLRTTIQLAYLGLLGLVVFVVLSVIPLFWCPWSVTWLTQKAHHTHVAKQYQQASDWYTEVIQLDPENAWAYLHRNLVYQELDQPDKACADLQQFLKMDTSEFDNEDPARVQSVVWLSQQAYQAHVLKNYETALAQYNLIIQLDPENAWAYLNRSGLHQELGHKKQAQADHKKALEIDPSILKDQASGVTQSPEN